MKIAMSIPSTVEGVTRDVLFEWIRRIDAGPFSRLCTGERIASPFLDLLSVLAAAASLTERVPIQSLISLAPLYEPVSLAKQAASIDVLSNGRFTMGVGVGIREYDYALMGKGDIFATRLARLDEQVALLRKIWSGRFLHPGAPEIGPAPVQAGGPPIFSSSLGPRSMRRAARWADGLAGFHMGPDLDQVDGIFRAFERAWSEAGREERPTLQLSFWFGLTEDAPERLARFAYDYLQIYGEAFAKRRSRLTLANARPAIREILVRLEDMGCDEAILTPTTASLDELTAAEDFVASL